MSHVAVTKINDQDRATASVFQEIEKRLDAARRRAYELFETRGCEPGRELDDWLAAEQEVFGDSRVDLQDKPGQFEVQASLPDFTPEQVEVTAGPGEIAIHALAQEEHKDLSTLREVYRLIELPKPVRTDQVTARLENGVLHITAPYAGQAMSAVSGGGRTIAVA